jgi:hypothetical protein
MKLPNSFQNKNVGVLRAAARKTPTKIKGAALLAKRLYLG